MPSSSAATGLAALTVAYLSLVACTDVPRSPFIDLSEPAPVADPKPNYQVQKAEPDPQQLEDLDLSACLALAMAHNRRHQRQRLAEKSAQFGKRAAYRELFSPRLNADYVFREGDDRGTGRAELASKWYGFDIEPFIAVDLDDGDGSDDTYESSIGLVVRRNLLRLSEDLRQRLPVTRATIDVHTAANNRIQDLRQLVLDVTEAFFALQSAQARRAIREARVADARVFLGQMEKLAPKTRAQIEATNARIDLNRARADLLREETSVRNAQESLLDLLGAPVDAKVSIKQEDVSQWPGVELDLDADSQHVLHTHERVRNHLFGMELLRQQLAISRDAILPDLDATLTMRREVIGSDPFDDSEGEDNSVSLGLSLDLPLDGFAAERARHQQDQIRLRDSRLRLRDIRSDLLQDLRRQYRRIDEQQAQVALAEERLAAEKDKLKATQDRFDKGDIDNLELTRAKAANEDAALSLLQARIGRILSVARYRAILPTEAKAAVSPEQQEMEAAGADQAKPAGESDQAP